MGQACKDDEIETMADQPLLLSYESVAGNMTLSTIMSIILIRELQRYRGSGQHLVSRLVQMYLSTIQKED